jgi:hypothetical protein
LLLLDQEVGAAVHPPGKCIHHGYASVALVPIRMNDRIVGLIQLNERDRGRSTLELVEFLEGVASHLREGRLPYPRPASYLKNQSLLKNDRVMV